MSSWVPVPERSPFTLANLPFGVAEGHVVVAVGDHAVDLARAAAAGLVDVPVGALDSGSLNPLLALGPGRWSSLRARLGDLLTDGASDQLRRSAQRDQILLDRPGLRLEVPVAVGDYVDGYAGLHHATTLGQILRPGTEPLYPNWRHQPVAYHGRAGTVVVSGSDVVRPRGQVLEDGVPRLRPSAELDVELELGAVVGVGNRRGRPVAVGEAAGHLFGYVLVNDWSARDIQSFEYQPLGPFLGKSFATSVSPWVVPPRRWRPTWWPGWPPGRHRRRCPTCGGHPRCPTCGSP